MRLLSQNIAQRANRDDQEVGKFWQARYRAVRLLDETAILACAAYVDLNPIRAAIAETLEQSDYTSVQKRIEALQEEVAGSDADGNFPSNGARSGTAKKSGGKISKSTRSSTCENRSSDRHLAPLSIDELRDEIGACCSESDYRASDKGFLPMSTGAYLELLDWTARSLRSDKTPSNARPIFERLGITSNVWCELVKDFGRLFYAVAGKPHVIELRSSRTGKRRYKTRTRTRELLSG